MKRNGSWQRALTGFLVFLMVLPAPVFGQTTVPVFRQEELDQMLAPIALYPDSLLAQVLMAATYPLEVVQADRWVRQNRNMPPAALYEALDRQNWDPSVKALVPFPDVLSMMSEKLDWTQRLGDAFLAQEAAVMESVQRLRTRAYESGYLRSSQQQTVAREGSVIVVQPANPQVVYVPVYSPTVVYGRWWYPAYPPVVFYPPAPGAVIAAGIITFGIGIAVAAAWNHGWGYWDWGHRNVYVNVNRTVNINRVTVVNVKEIKTTTWQHSPEHRKGVAYRDPATREKFAPANRQSVDTRRDYRGYDHTGPVRPGPTVSRPAAEPRPGSPPAVRPAPETKPGTIIAKPTPDARPGSIRTEQPAPQKGKEPAVSRPAPDARPGTAVSRPAPETKTAPVVAKSVPETRPAPAVSRPAPSNTIYGIEQGGKARKESARGRESLSSSRDRVSESPRPSPAASKPAPKDRPSPAPGGERHDGGDRGRK